MNGTVTGKKLVGTLSSGGTVVGGVGMVYGKDGKSAYEIAVKNGFEGTEHEWLESLKGDTGNPGIYLGSGDMPEDCNVQIDPNGDALTIEDIVDEVAEVVAQGFGIINEASGNPIVLKDSSNSKLQGLLLFGTEETASAESVTVSVMGKNLLDYRKAHARRSDEKVTIDERINGVYWTGTYYFIVPVSIPAGTSFRVSCQMESVDGSYNSWFDRSDYEYTDGTSEYIDIKEPKIPKKDVKAVRIYKRNTADNNQVIVWDLQLEIGTAVTEYEPYKEAQTLVVPTPNGLQTGEVLEVADANTLHTHKPNTTIINDAGAEMFVEYVADTKTYIDNKFTELQNAILSAGANV